MKKLNKVAVLFASAALAAPLAVFAQAKTGGDNWRSADGTAWKNGSGEFCWRDASWTPATAADVCDGALKPAPVSAPAPAAGCGSCSPGAAPATPAAPAGAGEREGDVRR
jgi:OOP family OmpA-OmpF porin